jgi:transcriptional regulator with XRE-family HTH domain
MDIALQLISTDEPFQVRTAGLDEDHVESLVAACESNLEALPPVVLTPRESANGVVYYIIDGHHEVEAQQHAGRDRVNAVVLNLSDDEAIDLAWARNLRNAKNLSFEDRAAHFDRLRNRQPSLPKKDLARICGLSRSTIWRLDNDVSRKQRPAVSPIVRFLRRIAFGPVGWDSAEMAAQEVRDAIKADDLLNFAQSLGDSALAALVVAEELGFSY